ncbi:PaaX family transcriptional regulator C-terminal domain-containing protein [Kutzneria sp. 744]|uniref:PaaX family transcriptional regulator C-terminal domain-containing protein n=1 Tax=Kutzneria sp. (strain 744) TaxID=345341 RepID=UPI0003EEBA10|nr:PaaX family transcriptional regulator C-terminal domain-containing protein [Kutzneria sp. 744]EWM17234.1 LigA protein [Kutzneria sp. 744]
MNDNATRAGAGRSVGLVPFLFGVTGEQELPGAVLTGLLADLGLSRTAARALIARMRVNGQLASTRRGREVDYRLAGNFARGFERIKSGSARAVTPWEGRFHALLYQVPEGQRAFRDLLRRHALFTGFGIMQPGVLIALTDLSPRLADVLAEKPDGASVRIGTIALSDADAAAVAYEAWDLAAVGANYRAHIASLRTAMQSTAELPAAAETLRAFAELTMPPMVDTLRDPGLPPELRPPDWPWAELTGLLEQVNARYWRPAIAYVRSRVTG